VASRGPHWPRFQSLIPKSEETLLNSQRSQSNLKTHYSPLWSARNALPQYKALAIACNRPVIPERSPFPTQGLKRHLRPTELTDGPKWLSALWRDWTHILWTSEPSPQPHDQPHTAPPTIK